ncbi:hypothetical protein Acid345_1090 [Candidatus Koribacter versatilis Ellin345]|uniref:Uncharacterized protein n=1 Tax=Koribacter versatilis (strain Ellin345) TaxID=204669 RepID=Q1ISQ7_KORVE|nr:hypothetical protein [Candidatus Koribacter versatilis]ABF40093.1 hypothetical protein Acid345_1090 [Candidatus Koribacter versatilis Ellin345]
MRTAYPRFLAAALFLLAVTTFAGAASTSNADSIVITFKDGHQQTFALADIVRMEFRSSGKASGTSIDLPTRSRYVGKWTVGDGQGHNYVFTLEENGQASNNVGSGNHGTWSYVAGEARISWDNGWHDIIRRVDMKYLKFAFTPGKSFDDEPSNVGDAHKNSDPI